MDVERVRARHISVIAETMLATRARATLELVSARARIAEFTRLWVRSEALGKARGVGLCPPIDDRPPRGFRVVDIPVDANHRAALAYDRPEGVNVIAGPGTFVAPDLVLNLA